jgi:hypothetical protein
VASDNNTAELKIELTDDVSGAAEQAANALADLQTKLAADTQELAAMQKAMRNLQGAAVVNIQQFKQLEAAIAAKKGAIGQAQGAYVALGGTFTKTKAPAQGFGEQLRQLTTQQKTMADALAQKANPAASSFAKQLDSLAGSAKGLPGPLGSILEKASSLTQSVKGSTLGLIALGVAVAAVTAIVIKAGISLTQYAIAQGNARRSELLRLEGLTKIRTALSLTYGLATNKATDLQGAIDRVAAGSAVGRDKIAAYAEQLDRMGVRGKNVEKALEGVAIVASTQGEGQASMFANWAAGYALTGRSVDGLTNRIKNRLGGIAQRQMLDSTVQTEKLHEAYAALFKDIDVEPFLKATATVNGLLSQSNQSGQALKTLLTHLMQPLVNAATAAQPLIKRFFQGMIISALVAGIVFYRLRNAWRAVFGKGDNGIDLANAALVTGYVIGVLLIGVFGTVAAAIYVVYAAFKYVAEVIGAVVNIVFRLVGAFNKVDWKALGLAVVHGIGDGIYGAFDYVVTAIENLGAKAFDAFRGKLQIHSPSRVFAELGLAIPKGVVSGIQTGTPDAQRAASSMISIPNTPSAAGPAQSQGKAAKGGGHTITIEQLTVQGSGDKPREIAMDIKREIERVLEGLAIEMGAPA